MKIEVGKYYQTRDCRKAYVGAIAPEGMCENSLYRVIGWVEGKPRGWGEDGREFHDVNSIDLIGEWEEGHRWIDGKKYRLVEDGKPAADDAGKVGE